VAASPPLDPSKTSTMIELRVRFCETDLMGIVHHGSYLVYFEAGRVEWLRRRGVTYASWAASGIHLPVVEVHVDYRAPSRFDDVLSIETRLAELRPVSMRFDYVIRRGDTTIVDGWTRLACIDQAHKLMRIPVHARGVLLAGEG
jgi:acyl-CoA thioester hydrolase